MDFVAELNDIANLRQEHLIVLCLNGNRRLLGRHTAFVGSVDSVMAHPREILGFAISDAASQFIIAHNHPSNDPSPSPHDIDVTQQIAAAGILMQIRLADHLIIAADGYFSFRERGML